MSLILETSCLLMRPLEINDAETLIKIKTYPNSIALKGHLNADTIDKCKFNIKKLIEEYIEYNIGRLAIIHKDSNILIGWAGLRYNPDFFGNDNNFCDFAFSFKEGYNNAEYLNECLNVLIPEGFKKCNINVIYTQPILKDGFEFEVYSKLNSKEIGYNKETNFTMFRIVKQ